MHRKHPLSLHFSPPYSEGEFRCDACGNSGHGFTFHCKTCKFDLHVACASLPEIEHQEDHDHPFSLLYSSTRQVEGGNFVCFVYKCSGANGEVGFIVVWPATVVPFGLHLSDPIMEYICKCFIFEILF